MYVLDVVVVVRRDIKTCRECACVYVSVCVEGGGGGGKLRSKGGSYK